jgi:hypothetical protein
VVKDANLPMTRRGFNKAMVVLPFAPVAPASADATPARDHGFRPFPVETMSARLHVLGGTVTAIDRRWAKGQSKHCRLCASCSAVNDHCLVITDVVIPEGGFHLHSTIGTDYQGPKVAQ